MSQNMKFWADGLPVSPIYEPNDARGLRYWLNGLPDAGVLTIPLEAVAAQSLSIEQVTQAQVQPWAKAEAAQSLNVSQVALAVTGPRLSPDRTMRVGSERRVVRASREERVVKIRSSA